ncbi:MAG: transcriptional regulator [Peptococcaceae bacterium BICA1-8]|nr:MAG: transcriptional regulator [Peptococcaceae bacterium BICA1-8]
MKHIFVVDDEHNIRDLIRKYLEIEGYKVTCFSSGQNVAHEIERLRPALIIMDIMMPGIDGLEVCRQIRAKSEVPIIFVSARDEELDRILGLEIGADDYLTKPFSPRELLVRIKNIFRRLDKSVNKQNEFLEIKDIIIYPARRYIAKDNQELKLTAKEYELFEFLVKNKKMAFSREQLLEKVWGYDFLGDDRIIDDLIKRIRKKLKDLNSLLEVTTVWGYGYRIDD